ncbi:MAG: toll/interleukin-1 receptor domain-containing protein [Zoogloeaceae bacterium]|nr:toll/interleukin-1 receptor domain-containing protein [Zoogloeaceae bacterium]
MRPVLFVSHSSKDNDLAREVVAKIEAGEVKTVFDVYDLAGGQEWRPQLFRWMARCQAALILLTPNGIESNWVLQEATVLHARKMLEPGFRVFVAAPATLRQEYPERWKLFEPLALDEIQGLQTLDAAAIAKEVAKALAESAAGGGKSFFERLAGLLEDILRNLGDKAHHTVAEVSERLQIDDAEWVAITGGDETLMERIAHRLCQGDLGTYADLRELLAAFKPVGEASLLASLLRVLAPYWVSPAVASSLPMACEAPPPRILALRARKQDFLPYRLLERIYAPYRVAPEVIALAGGNETYADLEAQLLRRLKDRAGFEPDEMDDDELFDLLAEDEATLAKQPAAAVARRVFVVLPHLEFASLALKLAQRFPSLVFIAPVLKAEALDSEWKDCRQAVPSLPPQDELRRIGEFTQASQLTG